LFYFCTLLFITHAALNLSITLFQQLFRIYHRTFRATLSIPAGGLSVVRSAIVLI
jgi:hypothetical protein